MSVVQPSRSMFLKMIRFSRGCGVRRIAAMAIDTFAAIPELHPPKPPRRNHHRSYKPDRCRNSPDTRQIQDCIFRPGFLARGCHVHAVPDLYWHGGKTFSVANSYPPSRRTMYDRPGYGACHMAPGETSDRKLPAPIC